MDGPFLAPVDERILHACTLDYITATGNQALAKVICAVCARNTLASNAESTDVGSIPSPQSIAPLYPHPHQHIVDGMLLYEGAIKDRKTHVCRECLADLKLKRTPALSLANNMWIGDVPPELSSLTLPERVLISRYFPAAYIVKLYPKNHKMRLDPRTLTSGLKGNVTTFPLDVNALADFVVGKSLPAHPKILAATIGITFVGMHNAPEHALRGLFRVSRARVEAALLWLKANNTLYTHLEMNTTHLEALPEDEVPIELLQTVRLSTSETVLEEEHGGYVPDATDGGQWSAEEIDGKFTK